jgi:hypothetical protein
MPKPYKEIKRCRICGNKNLRSIVSLGKQALTGVFPRSKSQALTTGPLELVRCATGPHGEPEVCGLVQLRHSYDVREMYGAGYGYHSGLNASMVEHLHSKVRRIVSKIPVASGDLIIDIGSNDSTLLQGYPADQGLTLVGIDPTGTHFKRFYPPHVELIPDFFSASAVQRRFGARKAKIVTSIAMFYDLEAPMDFMAQVVDVLAEDGVWVMEQSYLPAMFQQTAYDTICHEHLEYYGLRQIKWMADRTGLKIVDVEENDVNGGSFSVMLARKSSPIPEAKALIARFLKKELPYRYSGTYQAFKRRVEKHRRDFVAFLKDAKKKKKTVLGLGASTKGNVILQYCGVTVKQIPFIGEVNDEKFGAYTPGSRIPIIPEPEAEAKNPDYFLVLPWHFKPFFLKKKKPFLERGGKLLFPLPTLHSV